MVGLTLDAGALIACERRDQRFTAIWAAATYDRTVVTVPAAVLAQVWRGTSALLARLIQGCIVESLDETRAKAIGALLAKTRASDVVDATVVIGAALRGDAIVTSDPHDLRRLVSAAGAKLRILAL